MDLVITGSQFMFIKYKKNNWNKKNRYGDSLLNLVV